MKAGYNRRNANPCLFYSPGDDCSIMVHGDDFVAVGDEKSTQKLKKSLEAAYKVKCEILGGGKGKMSEIRVLNRVIRRDDQVLTLEADPRHAEIFVRDLCLENAKPSKLPCSKEEHKRSGGGPSGAGVYPLNAIDVEPQGAVDANVDMHEYVDKYTSKGKGRGSVRESAGLGKMPTELGWRLSTAGTELPQSSSQAAAKPRCSPPRRRLALCSPLGLKAAERALVCWPPRQRLAFCSLPGHLAAKGLRNATTR